MKAPWVLSVDDSHDDVLLLRHACKKAEVQFELTCAAHAEDALGCLARAQVDHAGLPSLILLDLSMPLMTGFEVLDTLRQDPATRGVVVAVFTSSENQTDVAAAYRRGADYYLVKPSDFNQLIALMRGIDLAAATFQTHPWACLLGFPTYRDRQPGPVTA